ncbi:leucyl/phenylalanyl-tRNA--protein transferase [Halomonas piscis]|uniref:Leucyl/phenylalanyl-tRNA--protein transferase n=1 Tax=Halomonas piscis TaxID=3031727 RepID=A0ABY9YWY6_9GAMM|nr:leucyl/phenylalanyl-tRNA--protein transferase [Halomonas piscis]WNK19389.1 leucyl/phenylalanyl-tRNA--protein transferase [Halomonas piscis]
MLPWLSSSKPAFPPPHTALAHPNGLLAAGGSLTPAWLVSAYRHGIFPWFTDGDPILWWSPDPRMVLFPEAFKQRRSLSKRLRHGGFHVTLNGDFAGVIRACAAPRGDEAGSWITAEMHAAYCRLHRLGVAHSLEVYQHGVLAGGLYGVALGPVFFGESMFSHRPDGSKVALAYLTAAMRACGGKLIDCQMHTPHLASLGAVNVARSRFLAYLDTWLPELTPATPASSTPPPRVPRPSWLDALAAPDNRRLVL